MAVPIGGFMAASRAVRQSLQFLPVTWGLALAIALAVAR